MDIARTVSVDPELATQAEAARQRQDYLRHLYQQLISWFTIFAGLNYASMGWLATKGLDSRTVQMVAALFVTQNLLGIACCVRVGRHFMQLHSELRPSDRVAPVRSIHRETILMMTAALAFILAAWAWMLVRPPA